MSLLKAQLRHSKYNTNDSNINLPKKNDDSSTNDENKDLKNSKAEDIRVKYVPGVILKINFENPIESDRVFKVNMFFNYYYFTHFTLSITI